MIRRPEELRLHPVLAELGLAGPMGDFNNVARLKNQAIPEPILITANGTILAGFGHSRLAELEGRHEVHCIEYPLSDDEALQFILTRHQPWRGWNAFVRIRVALTLEPYFQRRALDNMRAGGKYKGSANLLDLQPWDSLQEIGNLAGACPRYVSNVKKILRTAHPRLKEALQDGRLTINRAIQFCKLSRPEQLKHFIHWIEEYEINKVIRHAIGRPKKREKTRPDLATVLNALRQQEARQPGSIAIRIGRQKRTVVLVGQGLLSRTYSRKEPISHEIPPSAQKDPVSDPFALGPR